MSEPDPGAQGSAYLRRQRRRLLFGALGAVIVAGAGGMAGYGRIYRGPDEPAQAAAARLTVPVTRLDLVEHVAAGGTVGYGRTTPVLSRAQGTLTWLPRQGALVRRGQRLFAVDARPVPLLLGNTPMYRELSVGVPAGPDVLMLERNLRALGFYAGTPDRAFRSATASAIKRWQSALKVPETGRVGREDVVVLPAEVRVDDVAGVLGSSPQGTVLKVTGTGRLVDVELEEAQRGFAARGAKVGIEMTGTGNTTGTVVSIGTTIDGDKKPKLQVTITFDDAELADGADAGPVTVRFTGARRENVLAVPVQALLALREGGYAVEAAAGDQRYLRVELGLFADGMVEISGPGITDGMRVVTAG